MRIISLALPLVLAAAGPAPSASAGPSAYYANDYEDGGQPLDLAYWESVSSAKIDLHALARTTAQAQGGAWSVFVDYTVTNQSGVTYFQVPVDIPWSGTNSYVLDSYVRLEAPAHVLVNFGINTSAELGADQISATYPVTSSPGSTGAWERLLSRELSITISDSLNTQGMPPQVTNTITKLVLFVFGAGQGDRVTLYLDDLCMAPADGAITNAWVAEDAAFDATLGYAGTPDYPALTNTFPWGAAGSLDGLSRWLDVPLDVSAALIGRDWAESFYDQGVMLGGLIDTGDLLDPGGLESAGDDLAYQLYQGSLQGAGLQASVFLTGYSGPSVPEPERAQAFSNTVMRFAGDAVLAAWYVLDEPRADHDILRDRWIWAKKIAEPLDPLHPVTAALNNTRSVRMYSPYSAVTLIDWYPLSLTTFAGAYRQMTNKFLCQAAWESGARHLWFIPQAFSNGEDRALPTAAELRLQTYLPLAYGARGILYFAHHFRPAWHPDGGGRFITDPVLHRPTPMGQETRQLGGIVPLVAPALLPTTWAETTGVTVVADNLLVPVDGGSPVDHGIPIVDVQYHSGDDYDVLVAVNLDVTTNRQAQVGLSSNLLAGGRLPYDLHDMQQVPSTGGVFAIDLDAGDGRFIALATPAIATDLFRDIEQRHYDKLLRLYLAERSEAEAIPVDVTAAAAHADAAAVAAGAGLYPDAVAELGLARTALGDALDGHPLHADCSQRLATMRAQISAASWDFEELLLAIPWERLLPEAENPRTIHAKTTFRPYADVMKQWIAAYHVLRYGLMTGQLDGCTNALPACEQVGADLATLMADLNAAALPQIPTSTFTNLPPITPTLGDAAATCLDATRPLGGLILNRDFEASPYDYGWVRSGDPGALLTDGLNGTSQAVYMAFMPSGGGEIYQQLDPSFGLARLELSFAAAEPAAGAQTRSFDLSILAGSTPGEGDGSIQLRVASGNRLQHRNSSGVWTTVLDDFAYSVDGNGDNDFSGAAGEGDVLNVYRLRLDILVDGGNSECKLFVSEANEIAYAHSATGLSFGAVPTTATGISEIKIRSWAGDVVADFVIDELSLSPIGAGGDVVTVTPLPVDDVIGVGFETGSNATYRLQSTESLVSGPWTNTPLLLDGTGGPLTAFDPTGSSTRKNYRIVKF